MAIHTKKTTAAFLHPYASFLIYEWETKPNSSTTVAQMSLLQQDFHTNLPMGTVVADHIDVPTLNGVGALASYVTQSSIPSWSSDGSLAEVSHHLLVLLSYKGYLGVVVSDPSLRVVAERVFKLRRDIVKLEQEVLENALVRENPLRTLWLRSAHRRNRRKADSKVLIGQFLQEALNPLDDRTFTSPSMRAEAQLNPSGKASIVGVATQRSYVWLGPTNSVAELQNSFKSLIDYIVMRQVKKRAAIPVLAHALNELPKAGEVFNAFDFSFYDADSIAMLDPSLANALIDAEANLGIETVGKADQHFVLDITDKRYVNPLSQRGVWQIIVNVLFASKKNSVNAFLAVGSESWPAWKEFKLLFDQKYLWAVWYESGHTYSDGDWVSVDPRASFYSGDVQGVFFDEAIWDVTQEKPLNGKKVLWKNIGLSTDNSLFTWWIRHGYATCFPDSVKSWGGDDFALTVCDDGAGEIGDFVILANHSSFATSTNPSSLAVIVVHMKGAAKSKNRGMAPKQYEEVLGQATKNLSWVRFPELGDDLIKDLTDGKNMLWAWDGQVFNQVLKHAKKLASNSHYLSKIKKFDGRRFHSHVVVVQPHQDAGELIDAMKIEPADFKTRLLCTLLCAAEGACRGSSATLKVVMSLKKLK